MSEEPGFSIGEQVEVKLSQYPFWFDGEVIAKQPDGGWIIKCLRGRKTCPIYTKYNGTDDTEVEVRKIEQHINWTSTSYKEN